MRRQGSITVFFGMVLIVLCSLFFSMVETVRIYEMKLESRVITREALASAFSEYQPYLWDTYGILALDCGYGTCVTDASLLEQRIGDFAWDSCRLGEESEGKGSQFFQIEPYGCELLSYGCLSDQDGAELVRQGAMVARQQMTEEALTQWGSQYESLVVEEGNLPDVDACVQKAEEAMQNVAEEAETVASGEEMSVEQMSEEQMRLDDANHPLVIFREIKKQGFLGMVIGEHPVSDKTVSMVDRVSNRTRMEGTANNSEEIHAVDRLCYDWYLLHQFASFTNQPQTERALSYEVEYIIAGKDNDRDNLERVVVRMLGMRELQNCLTILKNPQMLQQTHQTALAIAGATANPVVIQAVQVAVVAIWALVESVLDLRTLLDGGKIPVLKSQEQWTSQLASLGQYLSHQNQANDEEQGLSYEHYLAAMVVLLPQKQITLRSMDLMEASLVAQEIYTNARMDAMVYQANVCCSYAASPMFGSYLGEVKSLPMLYQASCEEAMHY